MIHLDFIPIKRRPRFARNGHAYVDGKTKDEQSRIAKSYTGPKIDGPVSLYVAVTKPAPKGVRKVIPFTSKPDLDNVLKAVMDGLNGIAYDDDRQVVLATIRKHDREPGAKEGTDYIVEEIHGID